jgi:dephospho-CoA kinase
LRVAITGGIADGKSTVCSTLSDLEQSVVSADDVVAQLYERDEIIDRVRSSFVDGVVVEDRINRSALREAIAKNPDKRGTLNAIFHPAVMRQILRDTETEGVAFAEIPLLIETATQGWFDEVWVVSAGATEQRRRLVERLKSERDADAMLSTQLPTAAKIPFADRVIRTNEPLDTVKSTIAEHVKELLEERLRA